MSDTNNRVRSEAAGAPDLGERVEALRTDFEALRPSDWKQIPDIELYMDQVIEYMKRQHIGLEIDDEESLTPAMINNYIKCGVLPRARGKRYDREHIGYLTAICLLKQVLSVKESGLLLGEILKNEEIDDFYEHYGELIDRNYQEVGDAVGTIRTRKDAAKLAMNLAVRSYADKLACQQLVRILEDCTEENTEDE